MNQEYILDLFFSMKGDLDKINAFMDEKLKGPNTRRITTFEMFVKSRLATNPKVLKMAKMEISPMEAAYLSLYPALAELEVLDLRQNFLGDAGLEVIAHSEILKNLKQLDLRNNQISRVGMESLAQSKTLTQLEKIDLRSNKLGKRWEEKLKEYETFANLKEIRTL